MGKWIKSKKGDRCSNDCGEDDYEDGEDMYLYGNQKLCEGCYDDMKDDGEFDDYDNEDDYLIDGVGFQDPDGHSSLRAETKNNPRNLPCGGCGRANALTPLDVKAKYVCNVCADRYERGI